jgi:hypothetical protein
MSSYDNRRLPPYAVLADARIERATKHELADVAPLLALNIGWYRQRFGDVPKEALLKKVRAEALDDETLALLSSGMQNLVSPLAEVTGLRRMISKTNRAISLLAVAHGLADCVLDRQGQGHRAGPKCCHRGSVCDHLGHADLLFKEGSLLSVARGSMFHVA